MSDHFSGPRAIAGPAGDICDVYAFPSPEGPGRLVLVMTVLPNARPDSPFSDAIVCRFRLRPLAIEKASQRLTFGPEETELVFACTFEPPRAGHATPVQDGSCTGPRGETARFRVHDERGGHSDELRVYAGLRSDPFFLDFGTVQESFKSGRLAFKEDGTNSLAGFNVLGIVIESDCEPLLQRSRGAPLFAVVAETVVAGKLPVRLERTGRPEIKNHILSRKEFDQVNRDLEVRDLYNLEDAFHMGRDYLGAYRARMNANLPVWDHLDGKVDWPLGPDGSHPLTELLLADFLVVDVSKPFAEDSFFEIEQAMRRGRPHETCGGRSLNDDAMDTLHTLLINAGNGPRISDGVHQATVPASDVFPYLAPPNPARPVEDTGTQQGNGPATPPTR